jgi:hypothetical protein
MAEKQRVGAREAGQVTGWDIDADGDKERGSRGQVRTEARGGRQVRINLAFVYTGLSPANTGPGLTKPGLLGPAKLRRIQSMPGMKKHRPQHTVVLQAAAQKKKQIVLDLAWMEIGENKQHYVLILNSSSLNTESKTQGETS